MKIDFDAILTENWDLNLGYFFTYKNEIYMYKINKKPNVFNKLDIISNIDNEFGFMPEQILNQDVLNLLMSYKVDEFKNKTKTISIKSKDVVYTNVYKYDICNGVCCFETFENGLRKKFVTSDFLIMSKKIENICSKDFTPKIYVINSINNVELNFSRMIRVPKGSDFKYTKKGKKGGRK